MEDKIDILLEFEKVTNTVDINDFYVVTIWPNIPEIKLQGHYSQKNVGAALRLGVNLSVEKDGMLKGENEFIKIVLTD